MWSCAVPLCIQPEMGEAVHCLCQVGASRAGRRFARLQGDLAAAEWCAAGAARCVSLHGEARARLPRRRDGCHTPATWCCFNAGHSHCSGLVPWMLFPP
ncbi:hypothetical protein PSEUDO8AS_40449 [Pseudomonas sp. 8AS]|nr:hypothetical protein PSEUDO8AS_40449 [Pseudomonas sp. 8AS]